jgi:hypothetical protein
MLALAAPLLWVPLALPVQEPKAAPPAKTTDHGPRATDKPVWTPKDKETVVLLGSAFIEQEARDGYLETELIRLFPNKDIRVRNLGWSGDTVHCQARSYFGPPQEGFERLRGHLQMLKPTTVICCYGANESWKGEPGIPDFRKGYEKLIDMIREATGATVVLMTPPEYQPPTSDNKGLQDANGRLKRYWQEINYVAESRKCHVQPFGEKFAEGETRERIRKHMTTNGVDLTNVGYNVAAVRFLTEPTHGNGVTVDWEKRELEASETKVSNIAWKEDVVSWMQLDERLPGFSMSTSHFLFVKPLRAYAIRVDGDYIARKGMMMTQLHNGPEMRQAEKLRQAIIKKNALFFHRWRPANETYLYGFRKHEQGNNGVEPPMFDKLVEQAEAEIAKLKKPVPHKYELIRVEEKK